MKLFGLFGTRPSDAQINAALLLIAKRRENLADAQKKPVKPSELEKDELKRASTNKKALKAANKLLKRADQNAAAVFTAGLKQKERQLAIHGETSRQDDPVLLDDSRVDDLSYEVDSDKRLANALTAPDQVIITPPAVENSLVLLGTISAGSPAIIDLDKAGYCFEAGRKSGLVKSLGIRIGVESLDDGRTIRIYSDKPFKGLASIKLPVVEKGPGGLELMLTLKLNYKT